MARELPRTLLTLLPPFQLDVRARDYEIIVLDNGSRDDSYLESCLRLAPNIRIIRVPKAGSTPVDAINMGLALAGGEFVGVMIDGARMASPRLIRYALDALHFSDDAVVGTYAFHLGHETQMKSLHRGYDQLVEDALLDSVPWQSNGYRLFDISVFAGSSNRGWFRLPSETNALFMRRTRWTLLGGYDTRFRLPGGGLANLDVWRRACTDPSSVVFMLAGEGTFHQFHGGVATNASQSPFAQYQADYKAIRGQDYVAPDVPFRLYGSFSSAHTASLKGSLA